MEVEGDLETARHWRLASPAIGRGSIVHCVELIAHGIEPCRLFHPSPVPPSPRVPDSLVSAALPGMPPSRPVSRMPSLEGSHVFGWNLVDDGGGHQQGREYGGTGSVAEGGLAWSDS